MVLVAAAFLLPERAFADHVILRNGDRLTGTITSEAPAAIVVRTVLAGTVSLQRSDIASIARDDVPTSDADSGAGSHWSGAIAGGIDLSRGNSPSTNLAANTRLTRVTPHSKLDMFGGTAFSSSGAGETRVTNIQSARGGVRYDHDLASQFFAFGFGDLENDQLQLLDVRSVVGGGLGLHLIKNRSSQLNVSAGLSLAHDAYASESVVEVSEPAPAGQGQGQGRGQTTAPGLQRRRNGIPPSVVRTSSIRNVGELAIGQDWWRQLNDTISINERVGFFPAVGDFSDYRVSFDSWLGVQLNTWLQWNVMISDRFLNIPPAGGAVQNDLYVSTGVGITFGGGAAGAYGGTDRR
jgi:putative salt-induced outer membrane protein YdiY